jgi:hypothetical protein
MHFLNGKLISEHVFYISPLKKNRNQEICLDVNAKYTNGNEIPTTSSFSPNIHIHHVSY